MKLFVAVVMFFVVPVVFAVVDSPSPSVEEVKQKIEEAQLDKTKTQENQPAVRVIEIKPIASQRDADYTADEEKTNTDKPRDHTLLLSVLTVIFTGALVITGVLQYCVYKAQAKIMRRQLKAARLSAKAAQESAAAAKASANAVKAALQRERPYVLVTGVKLYNFGRCSDSKEWRKKPYAVEARCAMKSFGKTPAIIKTVVARLGPSTSPLPEPPDFSQCVKVYDVTAEIIGTGEESYARVFLDESEGPLTDKGWDILKDPNSPARIDVRGVITYEDPIGEEFTTSFGYRCVWGLLGESEDPHWVVNPAQSSYFKRT